MKRNLLPFRLMPLLLLAYSCHASPPKIEWTTHGRHVEVSLDKQSDSLYVLHLHSDLPFHSTWKLPYPVYRLDYGDITGNGTPEIVVGVIKPTRFDPVPNKRLFIYRIADGIYIRPLWLGSRVAQPLEDFSVMRHENPVRIRTVERERSGLFLVAEYTWKGFGLQFNRYVTREVDKTKALHLL